jgi:hypothetical protein
VISTGDKTDGNVDQMEKRGLPNGSVSSTHEVCSMLVISFELHMNGLPLSGHGNPRTMLLLNYLYFLVRVFARMNHRKI